MKYFETTFEDYLNSCNKSNFHQKLLNHYDRFNDNLNNIIFYGPPGSGKYTQALRYLSKFSLSKLKYEKRVCIEFNKDDFFYKISDIHIEVDIELLGCNAKTLWNNIYNHVIDIANTKEGNSFTILCKNFHSIHNELLHIFYSYMQTIENVKINYIILTEHLGYLPNNILNRCSIISVPKPSQQAIKSKFGNSNLKCNNLKNNYDKNNIIENKLIDNLILENTNSTINFMELRESIYKILIHNENEGECIYELLKEIIEKNNKANLTDIYSKIYEFFKLYNNNYRPIYHLEQLILNMLVKYIN